ncbi:MAG: alpha-hydroxy acid oxidase [Candidatus Eisenbacteria bacterium]
MVPETGAAGVDGFTSPESGRVAGEMAGLVTLADVEAAALARLPEMAREYLIGGAGDEITLRRNREAFDSLRLKPRVLRDVSRLDTRVPLLGRVHTLPIVLAPTAYHALFHPQGECETARGAAAAGVTMVVSTVATTALEEVGRASPAPNWFQIYCQRDRGWTLDQMRMAESSGYEAFVLTVDTPVLGARNREKHSNFHLPPPLRMANFPPVAAHYTPNQHHDPHDIYNPFLDPALTWKDVDWLRANTRLPVLMKGVLAAEDARLAVEHGMAGVIVSNHGGRNLDTLPATIEALPAVARAVGGRVPLLLDGGIRRGTDVVKALALGADAVLIGRPFVFGLALAGGAGVARVVELLAMELKMAMALLGVASVEAIGPEALWNEV